MTRLPIWLIMAILATHTSVLAQASAQSDLVFVRSIGAGSGLPEGFYRVASLAVGDSARVYVLDSGNCLVAVFDARGQLERKYGRCGKGPGEFTLATRIALAADGPAVFDAILGRTTYFNREGEVVRTEPVDRNIGTRLIDLLLLRGGAIGITMAGMTGPRPEGLYHRVLWLHNGQIDTVGSFHSGAVGFRGREQALPYGIAPTGLGRGGAATVIGDSVLVLVEAARGQIRYFKPIADRLAPTGVTPISIRTAPITTADRRRIEAEIRAESKSKLPEIDLMLPPGISQLAGNALVADDGAIWVGMLTASPKGLRRWAVLHRGAANPEWVNTPANFALLSVREGLYYGICRDEWDVESVCIYRRRKPSQTVDN